MSVKLHFMFDYAEFLNYGDQQKIGEEKVELVTSAFHIASPYTHIILYYFYDRHKIYFIEKVHWIRLGLRF